MGIKGGLHHQILYKNNVELIDEGCRGIEWKPPLFAFNGKEIPEEDYVEIHDDLFRRFHDYFIWIETYNPVGSTEFNRGFNYYGMTAIHGENLAKFGKLIDSLSDLFANAPERIILTGDYCFGSASDIGISSENNLNTGYYERIKIKADDLMRIFSALKRMSDRAIKNNGYLLHFGI